MATDHQKTRSQQSRAKTSEPETTEKRTEYLTAHQLAEVLQVSESTIHRLRRAGRIPAVELTDRLIRFNLRDVQKALKPTHAAHDGETAQAQEPSPQLSFDDLYADFSEQ
ncbi:MAG TPA: helix-turn-helix domain-containing protein [Blastocatellia bacterium]|nr:helix-turn-helix domain-containing protein [Blastocatellia bacterium]